MKFSVLCTRWVAALAVFSAPFVACSAGGGHSGALVRGGAGSTGSSGSLSLSGGSTMLNLGGLDGTGSTPDGGHGTRCDAAGNCSCIAIASIGHEGVWGPCGTDTTTAFQTWLDTQSTAKVDNYDTTKPTLTPEFLARYDVLILQWMVQNGQKDNDGAPWSFSADEVSALKDWVNKGGGLIALNGYQCEDPACIQDITATNQLLSFTDIQFNRDIVLSPKSVNQTDLYCWGGSVPLGASVATGAYSVGNWDANSPIGAHVTDVGAYDARSIHATTATVDCTDGTNKYAVHEEVGKGHVVAYGDEWITYSGEWTGSSACLGDGGIFGNMYDPCYKKSPAEIFQIAQLWYNAIKYASSSVACFDIQAPGIVK